MQDVIQSYHDPATASLVSSPERSKTKGLATITVDRAQREIDTLTGRPTPSLLVAPNAEPRRPAPISPEGFVANFLGADNNDDPREFHRPIQEIFIPIWKGVRVTLAELIVMEHPGFKRLADIYQLGQTHLVFRGATHRRWEHALGTIHAAQLMVTAVERNHNDAEARRIPDRSGRYRRAKPFSSAERTFIRLAALLHDLGHLSAGHTFEDELGLLDKHDADPRLTHVLAKTTWRELEYPSLRTLIDFLYREIAADTQLGITPSEIVLELVSKTRSDEKRDVANLPVPHASLFRLQACRDIVGNTICADLLDYLHRDWHHLGKPREVDNRLLEYFELRTDVETLPPADGTALVINLRDGSNVRLDAVTAVFELLESRYQLGEVALYHRTKLSASAMLERLVAEVADGAGADDWFAGQLDSLLECTDEELIDHLVRLGNEVAAGLKRGPAARLRESLTLGRALRYRELHKQVVAYNTFDLAGRLTFVRTTLGGAQGKQARLAQCRSLEEDFRLPGGSVVLYCPGSPPHAKIANVKVLVHESVLTLADLEGPDSPDKSLTAGLLTAQMARFDRLWRVQVSISPYAKRQLAAQHIEQDFARAVEKLVLRVGRSSEQVHDVARGIAQSLLQNPDFKTVGLKLRAPDEVYAQSQKATHYASGAPTISSLFVPG